MSVRGATLLGFVAVLLWALLAVFTALSGHVPPFQLVAMSFTLGGVLGVVYLLFSKPGITSLFRTPPGAWALGIGGLFGYHFFYFLSVRSAPVVEANLINYTWPLLIVLFSAFLPASGSGGGLKWWHVCGACLGLAGTILIVAGGAASGDETGAGASTPWLGYGAAVAAALTWSCYSVVNRRFSNVPSSSVAGFSLATALLASLAHITFETTVWPASATEWLACAALGVGPVGAAFYVWDYGVKRGDIRILGAAAYAAPLLSTLLLVGLGLSSAVPTLWIACLLITAGAALAAKDMFFPS